MEAPSRPPPLVDVHAHLTAPEFEGELPTLLSSAAR
jgi:hypothetical protein